MPVLQDICDRYATNGNWKFEQVYFSSLVEALKLTLKGQFNKRMGFEFVGFPPIRKKPIFRAIDLYEDNQDNHTDNEVIATDGGTVEVDNEEVENADVDQGDGEIEEEGANDAIEEAAIDAVEEEADDAVDDEEEATDDGSSVGVGETYECIHYNKIPILRSHLHPYIAIANALPKFHRHMLSLTPKQDKIYELLRKIELIWARRKAKRGGGGRGRGRGGGGRAGRGGKGTGRGGKGTGRGGKGTGSGWKRPGRVGTRTGLRSGGAPQDSGAPSGNKRKLAPTDLTPSKRLKSAIPRHYTFGNSTYIPNPSLMTPPPSTLPQTRKKIGKKPFFKYDDHREVISWIKAVAAAGTPEVDEQTIVWPVKEDVRQPYHDWHQWSPQLTFPPDFAKYSSNDRAYDTYMVSLPGPPNPLHLKKKERAINQTGYEDSIVSS
jgi:hypothetical protein